MRPPRVAAPRNRLSDISQQSQIFHAKTFDKKYDLTAVTPVTYGETGPILEWEPVPFVSLGPEKGTP